jgi:hypothetical protein
MSSSLYFKSHRYSLFLRRKYAKMKLYGPYSEGLSDSIDSLRGGYELAKCDNNPLTFGDCPVPEPVIPEPPTAVQKCVEGKDEFDKACFNEPDPNFKPTPSKPTSSGCVNGEDTFDEACEPDPDPNAQKPGTGAVPQFGMERKWCFSEIC